MFMRKRWLQSAYCLNPEVERVVKTIFCDAFAKNVEEILKVSFQSIFFLFADFVNFHYLIC